MKNKFTLILFCAVFIMGACSKKDDTEVDCANAIAKERERNKSIYTSGDTAKSIVVSLTQIGGTLEPGCEGKYLIPINPDYTSMNLSNMMASNDLSELIPDSGDYRHATWIVDVTYLGIRLRCNSYYSPTQVPGPPCNFLPLEDMELVEVTSMTLNSDPE